MATGDGADRQLARRLAVSGGGRVRLTPRIRIAAVGITPPDTKASGGISAGLQLMRRVAEHCETAMYVMADRDEDVIEGRLRIAYRRASNVMLPLERWTPRAVTTMSWRADVERWLGQFTPDIVHLHNPHPVGALRNTARTCNRLRIPYVISTHGFVEFNDFALGYGSPRWQRPLLKRLIREPLVEVACGARQVMMLSPFEEPIITNMGVSKDRLRVVPNGVDPYFLEAVPPAERERLTARFALPTDRPLLLFVGNHTANKGLDVLLQALTMMKEKCVALIAGAIRSRAEIGRLLQSCGVDHADPRFKFTDFVTKEELRALYRSVDVFVFPSRADTLPLVILEAMASSLPVAASNVGGIPFEVTEQTGLLVPPGDPGRLADALDRLCHSQETRRLMGEAGRQRVLEHFGWHTAANAAIKFYREVLDRPL
jgi:glycosyltransferase involved in cell wall biosynthesis